MKAPTRLKWLRLVATALILCAGFARIAGAGDVVTYPAPEGVKRAADFALQVDGKEVFVYENAVGPFAIFSFSGTVAVTVTVTPDVSYPEDLYWYATYPRMPDKARPPQNTIFRPQPHRLPVNSVDIRPKRRNLQPTVNGTRISFELSSPANLSIEINGNLSRPLFLFANPPEKDPPKPGDKGVQYFAAGKVYSVGQLRLNSNETIYIAGGAVVTGNILAENATNARILGRGILDGGDRKQVKSYLIAMRNSKNILVEGITILNDQGWTVVPRDSEDLQFINMKEIAWSNNSDGIDVVGCKRVRISDCFLLNDDDSIVIKSTGQGRGMPGRDVEDVEASNTVIWKKEASNAVEIGFELRTDSVRNILFKNIDIIHVEQGAALSIHDGDWATVSNVRFEDIWVEDSGYELIDIHVAKSIYSPDVFWRYARGNPGREYIYPDPKTPRFPGDNWDQFFQPTPDEERHFDRNRGHVENIYFKNIYYSGDKQLRSWIFGYNQEHMARNITLENVWLGHKQVLSLEDGNFETRFADKITFLPGDRTNRALPRAGQ